MSTAEMPFPRSSGVLLHVTSLPGDYGIGDLGQTARQFVDHLAMARQRYWQVLPIGPTGFADSPYQCLSSFAGNTNLIGLADLIDLNWLTEDELDDRPHFRARRVEYEVVSPWHDEMLSLAYDRFLTQGRRHREDFETFCDQENDWLDDFSLFMALKEFYGLGPWVQWGRDEALRATSALEAARRRHRARIEEHKFRQWVFRTQWDRLREYARGKGVQLIGDIPFYVAHDSCDVWVHRNLFDLDENGYPRVVAGVPPDYFSSTGQLWGNPLYLWPEHKNENYAWWIRRMRAAIQLFDMVRIDHFRGFYNYWRVPADAKTARDGTWVDGPRDDLFAPLKDALQEQPGRELSHVIVAEDLGDNMDQVIEWRQRLGLAGMKILQFAFGDSDAERQRFTPQRYDNTNDDPSIMYIGTHDNNSATGWWYSEATPQHRGRMTQLLAAWRGDPDFEVTEPHWEMIRIAMQCRERVCIIPMQDLLGAGHSSRMNLPGIAGGNWCWRCTANEMETRERWERLGELTEENGRSSHSLSGVQVT